MSDADFGGHSEPDAGDDGLGDLTAAAGPWDLDAAPVGAAFVAYGPLSLPAIPGLVTRLEYDSPSGEVCGVTVRIGDGGVQLQVVAARPGGDQAASAMRELIAGLSGRVERHEVIVGRFGPEVIARRHTAAAEGRDDATTLRFQAVDGGAWLIRAVSAGPSVMREDVVARVDAFLSQCAVDASGTEGLEPGTLIALANPGEESPAL